MIFTDAERLTWLLTLPMRVEVLDWNEFQDITERGFNKEPAEVWFREVIDSAMTTEKISQEEPAQQVEKTDR